MGRLWRTKPGTMEVIKKYDPITHAEKKGMLDKSIWKWAV
jgi:hypothetical protein